MTWGENFVCCVPFEDQAATTNNFGLGTPFAGNLEVFPLYRVVIPGGLEEAALPGIRTSKLATIVRDVLLLPRDMTALSDRGRCGQLPVNSDRAPGPSLLDVGGRKVMNLSPGANDVSRLSPGVYFVRGPETDDGRPAAAVTKVVIAR